MLLALASVLTGQNLPDSVTTNLFTNPLYERSNTASRQVANIAANTTAAVHHILLSGNVLWVRAATRSATGWLAIDDLNARSRINVRKYGSAVLRGHEVAETKSATVAKGDPVQVIRFESSGEGGFLEDFLVVGLVPTIVVLFGLIGWVMLRRK